MNNDDIEKLIVYELLQQKVETAKYIDIGGLRLYRKDPMFKELQNSIIDYISKEKGKLL